MTGLPSKFAKLMIVAFSVLFLPFSSIGAGARAEDACLEHARELLRQVPAEKQPELKIDASLNNPEAFSIQTDGGKTQIVGGGAPGCFTAWGNGFRSRRPRPRPAWKSRISNSAERRCS